MRTVRAGTKAPARLYTRPHGKMAGYMTERIQKKAGNGMEVSRGNEGYYEIGNRRAPERREEHVI